MEDIKKKLEEAHATLAEANKEIARLEEEKKLQKQLAKLSKVNQIRAELDAVFKKHNFSQRELNKYPKSYKYRLGRYRSNDPNEAWITDFLATGGTLEKLENNAKQHDLDQLKKLNKTGIRKPRSTGAKSGNTLKTTPDRFTGKTG